MAKIATRERMQKREVVKIVRQKWEMQADLANLTYQSRELEGAGLSA
jgi:hypothetical protein